MSDYQKILLDKLHQYIKEENTIGNNSIHFKNYGIVIHSDIVKLEEEEGKAVAVVNFYVDVPIFDEIFFECATGISDTKEKALLSVIGSFILCILDGLLKFIRSGYHYGIAIEFLGRKKSFKVSETLIMKIGDKEDKDVDSFWFLIKDHISLRIYNKRAYYIKVYGANLGNGEVIGEVRINNVISKYLSDIVAKDVKNWETGTGFYSRKQFFFIEQSKNTYIAYPYTHKQIETFTYIVIQELSKCSTNGDYKKSRDNIKKLISDENLAMELFYFIPEICAENAFKDANHCEYIRAIIRGDEYKIYKSQFTVYYMIKEVIMRGLQNGKLRKDVYQKLILISSTYNIISKSMKDGSDISNINVKLSMRFDERYELR